MDEQTLKNIEKELEGLRKASLALQTQIKKKNEQWEEVFNSVNRDNYQDIKWLINNPNAPESHKYIVDWLTKNYGSEYLGVSTSGYRHDGNYKNPQKNFDFYLVDYSVDKSRREAMKENILHFIENIVPLLTYTDRVSSRWGDKFPEMEVKSFQYKSESVGLSYLFYHEVEGAWYDGTLTYGQWDVDRRFNSFDEAFDYAYNKAQEEEND